MVQRVLRNPKPRPRFIEPMECKRVAKLPEGNDWVYEIKQDGYRAIGLVDGSSAFLYSMSGQDYSADFRHITFALNRLKQGNLLLDGEIVALDDQGRASFQELQNRRTSRQPIVYYIFDLLHHNGHDHLFGSRDALLRMSSVTSYVSRDAKSHCHDNKPVHGRINRREPDNSIPAITPGIQTIRRDRRESTAGIRLALNGASGVKSNALTVARSQRQRSFTSVLKIAESSDSRSNPTTWLGHRCSDSGGFCDIRDLMCAPSCAPETDLANQVGRDVSAMINDQFCSESS